MSFHIGVHALILDDDNKVLVTRRSALNNYMPFLWDIPGGSVDMGETVEQSLLREVYEEAGISVSLVKPIYVYTDLSWIPNAHIVQIIYKCSYCGGIITLNPEEHDEYQWLDYKDIKSLKCIAFLENLIQHYSLYNDL